MPKLEWNINAIAPLRDALLAFGERGVSLGADYGVTELITPPRIVMLRKRYREEIEKKPKDLAKSWAAFRGNAIHGSLEWFLKKHAASLRHGGYQIERKLFDKIKGRKITGKFDVLLNGALYDYKTTSTFKFIKGDFQDYEAQLNIYAYLLRHYNIEVTLLYIILLFTDWNKLSLYSQKDYPQQDFVQVKLDGLWTPKEQEDYLFNRVDLMIENESLPDNELTECNEKDMWARPDSWAIYPEGRSTGRAVRVLTSEKQAQFYIQRNSKRIEGTPQIIFRPGVRTRCENYCDAADYCSQYQEYLRLKGNNNAPEESTEE